MQGMKNLKKKKYFASVLAPATGVVGHRCVRADKSLSVSQRVAKHPTLLRCYALPTGRWIPT